MEDPTASLNREHYMELYRNARELYPYELRDKAEIILAAKELADVAEKKVADLGFGSGFLLKRLVEKGAEGYGVELYKETISSFLANNQHLRERVRLFQAPVSKLPLPENYFDAAISSHVFEHVADDTEALKEMIRILKPAGNGFVLLPTKDEGDLHYRNYDIDSIKKLFSIQDIKVKSVQGYGYNITKGHVWLREASSKLLQSLNQSELTAAGNRQSTAERKPGLLQKGYYQAVVPLLLYFDKLDSLLAYPRHDPLQYLITFTKK